MHAILSDEIVSQVAQGTTSIYAEVSRAQRSTSRRVLFACGLYLCWRIGSARAAPLHPPTGVEGRTRRKCTSSKGSDCVSWSAAPYECQKPPPSSTTNW